MSYTKKEVSEILLEYNWPGNIRELENVVINILVTIKDGPIGREHLPDRLLNSVKSCVESSLGDEIKKQNINLKDEIVRIEKRLILDTYLKNNKNIRKTARELGMSYGALQNKFKKYGIE